VRYYNYEQSEGDRHILRIERIVLLSVFIIILIATIACFAYEESQFVPVDTSGHAYLELAVLRGVEIVVITHELNLFFSIYYFSKYKLKGNKLRTVFNLIMLALGVISLLDIVFSVSNMNISAFIFIGIVFIRIIYCIILLFLYLKSQEKSEKAIDKEV